MRPESVNLAVAGPFGEVLVGRELSRHVGVKMGVVVYPVLRDVWGAAVPVAFGVLSL